jgi:enamine deaminase RidA (YjgF/YER057c/UK114 family)
VLKANVYLLSMEDWEAFNEVDVRRVGATGLPPRTTVQVTALGVGAIEIEMVAHVRAP